MKANQIAQVVSTIVALVLLAAAAPVAWAAPPANLAIVPPNTPVSGLTQAQWSAEWWKTHPQE